LAYTHFLITPMGFFCGTFFPLDNLPGWLALPMQALPLTQVTIALRQPGFAVQTLSLGITLLKSLPNSRRFLFNFTLIGFLCPKQLMY
jgi:ABC-type multidrug transport system permease subunit